MLHTAAGRPIHTADAKVMLAEIPFVRLHDGLPREALAVRGGLEAAQFEQNRSKINRRLATALSLAAAPYKICTQGERPTTRYGIALPAERISFA